MRKLSELLILVSNSNRIFKDCGGGLCKLIGRMKISRGKSKISREEYYILSDYIKTHRPRKNSRHYEIDSAHSAYYWLENDWNPRKAWLDDQIKKVIKNEKKNKSCLTC